MAKVQITGNYLVVNGEKIPLLSGEFHYFRSPKIWWPDILKTIKKGGFRIISSYVCWDFHEIKEGEYDFTGKTSDERDLSGFLEECKRQGLYILLRPGPYIGSEWKTWGIPDHATIYHRLHPEFLKKARDYIRVVCQIIKPYLVTKGGPIILLQSDNEIEMNEQIYNPTDSYVFPSPLYDKQIKEGKGEDINTFRWWLKQKYASIDALNKAYKANYTNFDEVEIFSLSCPVDIEERQKLFDQNEFYEWFSTTYLKEITKTYRDEGIDIPIYANCWATPQPMNYPKFQKIVDLVGGDYYTSDLISEEEFLMMSFSIRYIQATTRIPWSYEFQAGTVSKWASTLHGTITPQHHRYMALLAMLFGLKAWNWYMLVNRDEWYFSPINEKGEPREDYYCHFKTLVKAYKEIDWPSFENCSKIALVWDRPQHWLSKITPSPFYIRGMLSVTKSALKETAWCKVLKALHNYDLDFRIYDPEGEYTQIQKFPILLYAGFNFVGKELEEKILKYVEAGGNFIVLDNIPGKDLKGNVSSLSKILPPLKSSFRWGGDLRFTYQNESYSTRSNYIRSYDLKDYPQAKPMNTLGGETCGYVLPYKKGSFCVVGLDFTKEVISFIHQVFNVSMPCQSETEGVLSSVWIRKKDICIIVVNTSSENKEVTIKINLTSLGVRREKKYKFREILSGEEDKIEGEMLETLKLNIKGKDGKIFLLKEFKRL